MAKKALLDVLESTIGRYVHNLDANSLNVSVWSGKIDLGGLRVNIDAVNDELSRKAHEAPNLAAPFRIVEGKFDSLHVEVPWTRITSQPVLVRASGVSVMVEPFDHLGGSVDIEGKRRKNTREENIARAEDRRQKINALFQIAALEGDEVADGGKSEREGPSQASGASFTSKLVRRIIENMQVEIEDFDIRLRGPGCSVGVDLKSMALVTTDAQGNRTFVDRTAAGQEVADSFLYKALNINGLGLYCDEGESPEGNLPHSYIIAPLTFEASVRQSDLHQCLEFPKYQIKTVLPALSVIFSRTQLELTNRITCALAPTIIAAHPLFPEYRPSVALRRGTAELWWKYAVRCVGRLNRRRSWTEYFLAYKKRKRYIGLYTRSAHRAETWIKPLSESEKPALEAMEQDHSITVEGIMFWRNIADAQVDKEKERRKKVIMAKEAREASRRKERGKSKNAQSSIFGSSDLANSDDPSEPAITLTPDQMKELESATLDSFDGAITDESKLYEIKFTLRSFKIDLVAKDMRPLASLHMGTVASSFDANADGSFIFGWTLASLQVIDMVTPRSIFPSVVHSLQSEHRPSPHEAMRVSWNKTKKGDQDLTLRMVAFEVVASPMMLKGIQDFFRLAPDAPCTVSGTKSDESESDVFCDAHDDFENVMSILDVTSAAAATAAGALADNLTMAVADAWSRKRVSKKKWTLDCIIDAPVFVVPESCIDPAATVIVLDLGRFSVLFGVADPSPDVKRWFDSRQIDTSDSIIDHCRIELNTFACFIGEAGMQDWREAKTDDALSRPKQSRGIIEPMSGSLDIGIESRATHSDVAGTCVIGLLPTISLQATGSQIEDILSLVDSWTSQFATKKDKDANTNHPKGIAPPIDTTHASKQSLLSRQASSLATVEKFRMEVALRRLSATLVTDDGNGLEAHLVSIVASTSQLADGSSTSRLSMGWFWILDRLHVDFPREQRIIAHSQLPRSAASFAQDGAYDIMGDLEQQGVFQDDFAGSSDLAEVTVTMTPQRASKDTEKVNPDEIGATTAVDGVFSSLSFHYNPLAINNILSVIENAGFASSKEQPTLSEPLHKTEGPIQSLTGSTVAAGKDRELPVSSEKPRKQASSFMTLNARMKGLEISLNSPIDDTPLFLFAMTGAEVNYASSGADIKAGVTVQDILCEDKRILSQSPSFRDIICQCEGDASSGAGRECDLLVISYTKSNQTTDIEVIVGSPQIVILPDAVEDLLVLVREGFKSEPKNAVRDQENEDSKDPKESTNRTSTYAAGALAESLVLRDETAARSIGSTSSTSIKVRSSSHCRIVLVDIGNAAHPGTKQTNSAYVQAQHQLFEAVVVQGGFQAGAHMALDAHGTMVNSAYEISWGAVEMYTAQGRVLQRPIQILEPTGLSLCLKTTIHNDGRKQEMEIEAFVQNNLEFMVSLENVALLQSIATALGDALVEGNEVNGDDKPHNLSEEEALQIRHLASALDKSQSSSIEWTIDSNRPSDTQKSDFHVPRSGGGNDVGVSKFLRVKANMPDLRFTLINDLQGLDNGLFKVDIRDLAVSGELSDPAGGKQKCWKFHASQSISADYFDLHTNQYLPFLSKPWEITVKGWRAPSKQDQLRNESDGHMFTTVDVESNPCDVSFSEQFLVSLGAAKKMWSTYDFATNKAASSVASITEPYKGKLATSERKNNRGSALIRKSMAAFSARSFVNTLPYAVENRCGKLIHFELKGEGHRVACPSGTTQYFQFDPPRGNGVGGKRAYGQDIVKFKSLSIFVGERKINFQHLDAEVNRPRQAHPVGAGQFIFTKVAKNGRATYLHISSHVDIYNCTSLAFDLSVSSMGELQNIGKLKQSRGSSKSTQTKGSSLLSDGPSGVPEALGIPTDLLQNFHSNKTPAVEVESTGSDTNVSFDEGGTSLCLVISPQPFSEEYVSGFNEMSLRGTFSLPPLQALVEMAKTKVATKSTELLCASHFEDGDDPTRKVSGDQYALLVQVSYSIVLVGNRHPFISIYLQPRTMLRNQMPINLLVSAPKLHTISRSMKQNEQPKDRAENGKDVGKYRDILHKLCPFDSVEIYTPLPTLSVSVKCADTPAGGSTTGWTDQLDVPLGGKDHQLSQPITASFPFVEESGKPSEYGGGMHFVITNDRETNNGFCEEAAKSEEVTTIGQQVLQNMDPREQVKTLFLSACNILVDHTGDVLVEEIALKGDSSRKHSRLRHSSREERKSSSVNGHHDCFSAFKSPHHRRWLALLPTQGVPMRMLRHDQVGIRSTSPFCVEDVIFCDGGAESSTIMWDDGNPSGFYAYRKFSSHGQSTEIHIVPEFVVYNGSSGDKVLVKQPQDDHMILLSPGEVSPIQCTERAHGLFLTFELIEKDGITDPIRVDELGMRVCIVKATSTGSPIGCVAVQTDIGKGDSRLVIKLGNLKMSGTVVKDGVGNENPNDFLRFRIRASMIQLTLNDTQQVMGPTFQRNKAAMEEALGRAEISTAATSEKSPPEKNGFQSWDEPASAETGPGLSPVSYSAVAQIILRRLTVDYQRIFTKNDAKRNSSDGDEQRSQLAFIIRHLQVKNCTPNCTYPVVLDTSHTESSFFDLCIRSHGSGEDTGDDLVPVDLLDLNLAYNGGKADHIVLQTEEDFAWSLLDVANRTIVATSELAGVDLQLEWDEEKEEYVVSMGNALGNQNGGDFETYTPPRSDTLYDIKSTRVSPMKLLVSFKRQPQRSRYKLIEKGRGAKLMNYFTTQLSFTIDRAELNFAGYAAKNVKGPPDRLIKMIVAVYTTRLKRKAFSLITAVNLQDWNNLAAREDGVEDFVEGDVLRLTGNVAGRSAGYILKTAGQGLGDGVIAITGAVGNEIEYATEKIGAGAVGAGINRAVAGVGEGVGTAVKGVGAGGGKIIRGAGKGAGQIVGGVGGGVLLAAQGRLGEGAHSAGYGVGQGVETLVVETAEGVHTFGEGLFSGIKKVALGCCSSCMRGGEDVNGNSHGSCAIM